MYQVYDIESSCEVEGCSNHPLMGLSTCFEHLPNGKTVISISDNVVYINKVG